MNTVEQILMRLKGWLTRTARRPRALDSVSTSHRHEARAHQEHGAEPLVSRLRETGGL
ncbi:MAG: hypothetical protein DIU56_009420 [Pseudomonadota bacterium]|jgi:hypothetical protein